MNVGLMLKNIVKKESASFIRLSAFLFFSIFEQVAIKLNGLIDTPVDVLSLSLLRNFFDNSQSFVLVEIRE